MFGHRYSSFVGPLIDDPIARYAPTLEAPQCSIAVSVPSRFAPIRIRCTLRGRLPAAWLSSARVNMIFTGRRSRFEASAAMIVYFPAPFLLPNPPPMNGLSDPDAVERDLERARDLAAHAEDVLRGVPDRQLVAVPVRDRPVRLHAVVEHVRGLDRELDRDVRLGEAPRDVAALVRVRSAAQQRAVRVDPDRARSQRRLGVDHVGQRLVLHLDQVQRVARLVRGFGDHERDLVADVPQFRIEQPAPAVVPRQLRRVGRGQHQAHARRGLGLRGVEARDAGVGVRAPQHRAVEQPRGIEIGGVPGGPAHPVRAVDARHRGADHLEDLRPPTRPAGRRLR